MCKLITCFASLLVLPAAAACLSRGALCQAGTKPASPSDKTPLDILRERFARGEIDTTEFEERRRVLEGREARQGSTP